MRIVQVMEVPDENGMLFPGTVPEDQPTAAG